MSEFNNNYMEDISSSSKKSIVDIAITEPVNAYGNFFYRNIAKVLKAIAYIVAIFNLITGLALATYIFKLKLTYIALSFAVVLVFSVIAAFLFFIIYGIGHSIEQNNEILRKLN